MDERDVKIEKNEDNRIKNIKFFSTLTVGLSLLILIVVKVVNKHHDLRVYLIIGGLLILFWAIFFFGGQIMNRINDSEKKLKEFEKLPPITPADDCRKMIEDEFLKDAHRNHIKKWVDKVEPYSINGNMIYCFEVELLYGKTIYERTRFVLINAHYPKQGISILLSEQDSSKTKTRIANQLSTKPFDEPDVEKSEESTDAFGRPIRKTEKITRQKKEVKKEEKKDIE